MLNATEIRNAFLGFFRSKAHQIVPSAPMVIKNDPTLMFTNAGMNQFKDIFLGNSPAVYKRIADSQKCLRVSGKHNDLEEVGHDTYHHTMFEMLGNWSFGDYFKKDAINWAWEFLVEVLKIDENDLYATVFEGYAPENLEFDNEAYQYWNQYLPKDRILNGNKKDNFWEMGDTGPCGPCSEVHVDIRSKAEKELIPGRELVNKSHPQVIEIWNLVFIQFNRKANGSLEQLPDKHVDTGMGFERLCMVVQGKQSNYDSDVFQPLIQKISQLTGIQYGADIKSDVAMRVASDHLRTISFAIADGQLPSNNKAGYVIRRILRRAVRYAYTYLQQKEPFLYRLLPTLLETMGNQYPELVSQKDIIENVMHQEESTFLHTLDVGISLLDKAMQKMKSENNTELSGDIAFLLYDTHGFPLDLTELILRENNMTVNQLEFTEEKKRQQERSRAAASVETLDWVEVGEDVGCEFVGYDVPETDCHISRYRKVKSKNKEIYQLVFDVTPFYAESGGQVGDVGVIKNDTETIAIIDTKKENNLSVHIVENLPKNLSSTFKAVVDGTKRAQSANNHSATHLLHQALREVVGMHVEQKGSMVDAERLRFDFSHFQKLSDEEILKVETIVNQRIRQNFPLEEMRSIPIQKAKDLGAIAFFGEKYGEQVRAIKFGTSMELCGGTHVNATGRIGIFKIVSESSIAAGIRRIEAITADNAEAFFNQQLSVIQNIKTLLKNPADIQKNIETLINENGTLRKHLEVFERERTKKLKDELKLKAKQVGSIQLIAETIEIASADAIKDMVFQLQNEMDNVVIILGAEFEGKAHLTLMLSESIAKAQKIDASKIVREAAKEIQGGGGGQTYYATAGGKKTEGLHAAIESVKRLIGL